MIFSHLRIVVVLPCPVQAVSVSLSYHGEFMVNRLGTAET